MTEVVSVKFKGRGKTYFFDPNGVEVPDGAQIVVETSKGLELAECVQGRHEVTDTRIVPPLRPVIRVATADDLRIAELCKHREKEAFAICEKKIAEHSLDMKLVDVECNFEGNKILFFFTSDGRVDFRELVKDLAGVFRTRIELRQIGVRDEAKMLGGLGICGRPFCCKQFLNDFEPVSTKMAKTQSLSLNPAKISGSCGRLMCCLRYEEDAYEELVKTVPKNGAFVETIDGYGNVVQVNLLRQEVKVRLDAGDVAAKSFKADEVAAVPGGRPKPGDAPAHVLQPKPKAESVPAPPVADPAWERPPMFAEDTLETAKIPAAEPSQSRAESHPQQHRKRPRNRKPGEGRPNNDARSPKDAQNRQPAAAKPAEADKTAHAPGERDTGKPANRRPRRRKSGAGGNGGGEGAPRQENRKPAEKPVQDKAPRPAQQGENGGEKKPNSNNRRRYHNKPKPKEGGAPKAE